MTFRQFAIRNIKGNWVQYSAYFLSSVFSVMVFYMYTAFIWHPEIKSAEALPTDLISISITNMVSLIMTICNVIIFIFSFFFILYSNSAFLKKRKKEFGLYTLFGMTNWQIRKMVFLENMAISLAAIGTGLGLGTLFSKLFFMILSQFLKLDKPIAFYWPYQAMRFSAFLFLGLFLFQTFYSLFRIKKSEIIDLIQGASKPKTIPKFSWVLVALSVICITAGYFMAYTANIETVGIYFFPFISLVIVGTYFLFTQSSILILKGLQNRKSFFYSRINMIAVSQLLYKIKDNARMLFTVTMLSAVVLTATASVYIGLQILLAQALSHNPQSIAFLEKGRGVHDVIDPKQVERILAEDKVNVLYKVQIPLLHGNLLSETERMRKAKGTSTMVISEDSYNQVADLMSKPGLQITPGHAVFADMGLTNQYIPRDKVEISSDNWRSIITIEKEIEQDIFAPILVSGLLIVSNEDYEAWRGQTPEYGQYIYYAYELENWKQREDTVRKISEIVPEKHDRDIHFRVQTYKIVTQISTLVMFIGLFISVLFFLAAGSITYFKLFTEIEDDRSKFRSLMKVGMTIEEIRRVVGTHVGIMFFIPCLVGTVHTLFAVKTLNNLMGNVWLYAGIVIGCYWVLQTLYFLVARNFYMKWILREEVK
ncbi:ABC transporter permease [Paenibacillus larvae]|uniref:FtsX-like permease family protein n=1 Tax=Paenibacillus larvae TaxID=1464 RepID=UPI0001692E7E|nr:ABC transporter permease [Paenibacillus larvae]AQR76333.1 ABC transporter permease [Paenibacillus larvae subsp. larvae]AVF22867.1 efflux ABC transporter, permease protein [Paenibacillus larvae subsp. larvae]ETK26475.1 efflux ABC transporter, permease protein [Paenibacillus larvae subsp. larvae DSM 25719]MCY7489687.1 ABC transporter permease [Paenibacillus larvae]MCY9564142.1 ABC transporter permease [Paenibacillus larvae]